MTELDSTGDSGLRDAERLHGEQQPDMIDHATE